MNLKAAKALRRAIRLEFGDKLPKVKYKTEMVLTKIWLHPLTVDKFADVKWFKGSPYIEAKFPQVHLDMSFRKVYQDAKKAIKNRPKYEALLKSTIAEAHA